MDFLKSGSAAAVVAASLLTVSPAVAQNTGVSYYVGGGLGAMSAVSTEPVSGPFTSAGTLAVGSLVAGVEVDKGQWFFGGEVNVDFSGGAVLLNSGVACTFIATGPYACTQNYTARAVGIVGAPAGAVDVFGSLGFGQVGGTFATTAVTQETATVSGLTYGIGIRRTMDDGWSFRGEVIVDQFNASTQTLGNDSDWAATSVRMMVIKRF